MLAERNRQVSTETKIQRYGWDTNSHGSGIDLYKKDEGQWVRYSDHLAAVEEAREAALEEAITEIREQLQSVQRSDDAIAVRNLSIAYIRALNRSAEKGEKA
jgi:hypothetical protein